MLTQWRIYGRHGVTAGGQHYPALSPHALVRRRDSTFNRCRQIRTTGISWGLNCCRAVGSTSVDHGRLKSAPQGTGHLFTPKLSPLPPTKPRPGQSEASAHSVFWQGGYPPQRRQVSLSTSSRSLTRQPCPQKDTPCQRLRPVELRARCLWKPICEVSGVTGKGKATSRYQVRPR